ncbi:MAG: LexA family transcriptional regulator [Candidimonas sp.]|nr:MAG: LexA family transcriptional regulator [Candidimonas sp.]TAM26896.1 MAG: LexA family transcriptional regulator [Candidimonas sp.]
MAKPDSKLEHWQIEDAARLKAIFEERKPNQTEFGVRFKIGSQGFVWQLLNAHRPLGIKHARAFAEGLGVPIDAFSPTLAKQIADASERIEQIEAENPHVPVRMLDAKASAGKGDLVFSEDTKKILMFRRDYLAKNSAKAKDVLGFEVDGDSMVDMHIIDGSVVLANQAKKEPISKRVYVLWVNGKLYVKQLVKVDNLWYARSRNIEKMFDYPDIQIDIDDRIVGRAFWCGFGL